MDMGMEMVRNKGQRNNTIVKLPSQTICSKLHLATGSSPLLLLQEPEDINDVNKDEQDGEHLENLNGVSLLQTQASRCVCSGDALTVECEPNALVKY